MASNNRKKSSPAGIVFALLMLVVIVIALVIVLRSCSMSDGGDESAPPATEAVTDVTEPGGSTAPESPGAAPSETPRRPEPDAHAHSDSHPDPDAYPGGERLRHHALGHRDGAQYSRRLDAQRHDPQRQRQRGELFPARQRRLARRLGHRRRPDLLLRYEGHQL